MSKYGMNIAAYSSIGGSFLSEKDFFLDVNPSLLVLDPSQVIDPTVVFSSVSNTPDLLRYYTAFAPGGKILSRTRLNAINGAYDIKMGKTGRPIIRKSKDYDYCVSLLARFPYEH